MSGKIISLEERRAEVALKAGNNGSTIIATVTRLQAAPERRYRLDVYQPWRRASYTAVVDGGHAEIAKFIDAWRTNSKMMLWGWRLDYESSYPGDENPFKEFVEPLESLYEFDEVIDLTGVEELHDALIRAEQ